MKTAPPSRRRLIRWFAGWTGLVGFAGWRRGTAAGSVLPENGAEPGDDARPVPVSLADVAPGEIFEVEWRGRPVFVRHRTSAEIARERAVPLAGLRDPEPDEARVQRAEWVVVEGSCTHGGCIPTGPLGDFGGWYCLCHGSQFDTAGRVRAGPARENLKIPPYRFTGKQTLLVGVEP